MAYKARNNRGNSEDALERQNNQNAEMVRSAADAARHSGNPYARAAGTAVKVGDRLTGGKVSNAAGRALSKTPVGKVNQLKQKYSPYNRLQDTLQKNALRRQNENKPKNNENNSGGEQGSSPSSDEKNGENKSREEKKEKRSLTPNSKKDNKPSSPLSEIKARIRRVKLILMGVGILGGFLVAVIIVVTVVSSVTGIIDDFKDALAFNTYSGRETGNLSYDADDPEQQEFFERVNDVELDMLSNGQQIDALKIIATFHILKDAGANIDYGSISDSEIKAVAEAQLNGGFYDEEAFKSNLVNSIIPRYLPRSSKGEYEELADKITGYIEDYYKFIDEEAPTIYSNCTSSGSCSYDIKGFYIKGKGNYTENIQVNNLYVRLMQCGTANGHNYGGTFGKPLEGEELVPFEKYILGVAYQEIGPDSPAEAIKAQMVAARSYILARHADMGGWRTLKQEAGTWVLQAASCTQDQVYCDPDKGCSGTNGQWGQVHSGQNHNQGFSRAALPQNSPLRTYLNQTSGDVLVNSKGNIIYSGYTSTEQDKMISLAKQGLSYKEILLQVYNQGDRNYGATDIKKAACSAGSISNCGGSTGAFSTWKQAGSSWSNVRMGNSGRTIGQIGCLVTSISMLIAKSGVQTTIANFNPGTFVQFLNNNGGFDGSGNLQYAPISKAAPSFKWVNQIELTGSREQKLNTIRNYQNQGYYMTAEVSPNGQHWVAIDSVNGNSIKIMDPGSSATDLWGSGKYTPQSTKTLNLFKVG